MLDDYRIVKCILDPRGFHDNILSVKSLFRLDPVDQKKVEYATSSGLVDRFPGLDGLHDYGIRTASAANEGILEREGKPPEPDAQIQYVGHYQIRYRRLRQHGWPLHVVNFCWREEANLLEHYHIEVRWNGIQSTKHQRRDERLEIQVWLSQLIFGPFRFQVPYGRETGRLELPVFLEQEDVAA